MEDTIENFSEEINNSLEWETWSYGMIHHL